MAQKQISSSDFIGRYGGEEFALVISESTGDHAYILAERIGQAIENSPISIDKGKEIHVTVSIGIASFPIDADTGQDLISAADQALYAAKKAGRNQVFRYIRGGQKM